MADRSRTESLAHGVAGLVILLAVAVLWFELLRNPALGEPHGRDPGPAFMPRLTLALLGASSLWIAGSGIYRSLFKPAGKQRLDTGALAPGQARQMLLPALMLATLIGFVWLMPILGFLPVAIAFSLGWSVLLALQEREAGGVVRIAISVFGSLAFAIAVYFLFSFIIGVPL